jgi:hypothetical protein
MRFPYLAAVVCAAFALLVLPAEAAWNQYFNRALEFSFLAPGELRTEKGTYKGELAGEHNAVVYRSVEDNIEYVVTVVDFSAQASQASEESALLAEAEDLFRKGKNILADGQLRVDAYIGRRITADLPGNRGRSSGAFYFKRGHLILLVATVLPANGDYGAPDLSRFVESLSFQESRVDPGAIELTLSD